MKIETSRRKLFALFGAAPLVARAAAEKIAAEMSGVAVGGLTGGAGNGVQGMSPDASPAQWRTALLNPAARREVESVFYEDNRYVGSIDPDLAVLRSFSLNAKITFQRQRNVQRRIEQLQSEYPWQKLSRFVQRFTGFG